MNDPFRLIERLPGLLGNALIAHALDFDEVTCEIAPGHIRETCLKLRDDPHLRFASLMDLCGVDYAAWGADDSLPGGTDSPGGAVAAGVGRQSERFAVVYHLLSVHNNLRLRLRVSLDEASPAVDSVVDIWPSANWYEREAFDLFGIIFNGHPDLRRLLTDYGFIGHPLRKDFPLSGQVEMRYDEEQGRVIYQPVTIEPRILVPRAIRKPVVGDATAGASGGENNG